MTIRERIVKAISPRPAALIVPGSKDLGMGIGGMPAPKPMIEFGVSGLNRTKNTGFVFEEWLADLSTSRAKQVYREMRDNDAVIGSMFFALEMILRRAEWRIEPAKTKEGQKLGQFVTECMDDMSHSWEDFVAECVSMFAFGFALFETVYKRRQGPDGRKASKFNDGLIGWRKLAPRAQESILYWIWDDDGGLQGAVQLAAPDYRTVPMPIEKLLLFRTTSLKNNPEGRSVLRNCYRSYMFKKRIEEIEGIGIERDLCGIPVLYIDGEALTKVQMNGLTGQHAAEKLVRDIRLDDQMGVVLPQSFDEKGNPRVKLELLKTAGQKQTDPGAAIARYNADMLNTMLAGFVQFGQTPTGSRALHMSATQIFSLAIGAFMDSVAAVMNRIAIPRLLALNGMDLEAAPKLVAGEIGVRDLEELADFVQKLSASGLTFFDRPTANYIRKVGRMPEQPEDEEGGPAVNPNAAQTEKEPQQPGRPEPSDGKKPGAPTAAPAGSRQEGKERLESAV